MQDACSRKSIRCPGKTNGKEGVDGSSRHGRTASISSLRLVRDLARGGASAEPVLAISSVFNLTGEQAIPVDLGPPLTPAINV